MLFHSRYSTNTTTAWRRAQPFWVLAHNGEISTIRGNVAWMHAIGQDLVRQIVERHPSLKRIAARVTSIICSGGSDSANLDDMLIALMAGGMSMAQGLLALLPEAPSMAREEPVLSDFHAAMSVLLGACDGPAAIVACDGGQAVAHLDRNGLRPLWITTTRGIRARRERADGDGGSGLAWRRSASSGRATPRPSRLSTGEVQFTEEVHRVLARQRFPRPARPGRGRAGRHVPPPRNRSLALQAAFGMTKDDLDVGARAVMSTAKLAVGSMGDDTPPAALLDALPRRLDDYFKLRFAQETSPPIDPIRDAWVFETDVALGDRSGLWNEAQGPHYVFPIASCHVGDVHWLLRQERVAQVDLCFPAEGGADGLERALDRSSRRHSRSHGARGRRAVGPAGRWRARAAAGVARVAGSMTRS